MRRVPMMMAAAGLVVGLAAPAWAGGVESGEGRPTGQIVTTRHHGGNRDGERRFHSASDDAPGDGRSHYDRLHHDDPVL